MLPTQYVGSWFDLLAGVGSFFKGIGKGVIGVVVKPVTGVVDAVSAMSTGIKNQSTTSDERVKRITRQKHPSTMRLNAVDQPTLHDRAPLQPSVSSPSPSPEVSSPPGGASIDYNMPSSSSTNLTDVVEESKTVAEITESPDSDLVDVQSWTCQECSFVNVEEGQARCVMCQKLRQQSIATARQS